MNRLLTNIISAFILSKKKRRAFKETSKQERNRIKGLGNKIIFINAKGEETEINPKVKIKGLRIIIDGNNNIIRLGRKQNFKKNLLTIRGDDNSFKLGSSPHLISNVTFDFSFGSNRHMQIGQDFSMIGGHIIIEDNNTKITIGNDCMFSLHLHIRNSDSHTIVDEHGKAINHAKDMHIGNHVWIGASSIILKSITVADNCIIGAGSVVSKSFTQEGSAIAGNPAEVVKKSINWSRTGINDWKNKP